MKFDVTHISSQKKNHLDLHEIGMNFGNFLVVTPNPPAQHLCLGKYYVALVSFLSFREACLRFSI